MRALFVVPILAAPLLWVGPAAPQVPARPYADLQRDRDARTVAERQAAREHDTALKNDLSTLQASEQTRQVLADIAATGVRPPVPAVPFNPKAPPPKLAADQFAQIPDAALAASNARAVAASQNKH